MLLPLLLLPLALALPQTTKIPTVPEAAIQARHLLRSNTIGTLSTIFPADDTRGLAGLPVGLMDYYADCGEEGDVTLLAMGIATSFKNVKAGSPISLSIREHKSSWSPASQPRLSLIGHLGPPIPRNSTEAARLQKCFLSAHHDARLWAPGNKVHESDWVTLVVEKVYWVGGFGNVAYIGWIPEDVWRGVRVQEGAWGRWWGGVKGWWGEL